MKRVNLGIYDPNLEKDNCGFGLIVQKDGMRSRELVLRSIKGLINMTHRGAVGSDAKTGDGCGYLFDINHDFFRYEAKKLTGAELPKVFAIAQIFHQKPLADYLEIITSTIQSFDLELSLERKVPTDDSVLGEIAYKLKPQISQLFITSRDKDLNQQKFEASLFEARKLIENIFDQEEDFYICSMSSQTIVYKGLMMPAAIKEFYLDIASKHFISKLCLFHQRFSTNTSPKWHLAQPFRMLAHNGEINAIKGNRNWARSRKGKFASPLLNNIKKYKNLVNETGSDSSALDNMLELLSKGGVSIFRALRMVIPPAWQNIHIQDPEIRAFHEFNSMHMEAWDGPAGLILSDGRWAICALDRNGLRPARYQITDSGFVTIASEIGIDRVADESIISEGRVSAGGIFAVDTTSGKIINERDIDLELSQEFPFRKWLKESATYLESNLSQSSSARIKAISKEDLLIASKFFLLYTEERNSVIRPLAEDSSEGTGSMGDDTALAALSSQPRPLYDYFRQQFAQVTNPPIDPIRETSVMSLETCFGPEQNIFEQSSNHAKRIVTTSPVLSFKKLNRLLTNKIFKVKEFELFYSETKDLKSALKELIANVTNAVRDGNQIIHLKESLPSRGLSSMHALMAVGAIHQALVKNALRADANIVISTGSARDTHQIACLISYGATAVYPWLAFQTIMDLTQKKELAGSPTENCAKYRKGINKGLFKIISKLGISTISSYRGSQLHEIVGLGEEITDFCFTGSTSNIGGLTFQELENFSKNNLSFARSNLTQIRPGGLIKYVHGGEYHAYNPEVVRELQDAVKYNDQEAFKKFSSLVNNRRPSMLRDLLELQHGNSPISLDRVETKDTILKRFDSAGMSLGALSPEAHETLAEAMNALGARSNSGEGGEAKSRYRTQKTSKIKQIASGRFGVTPEYLINADVLQIKIAQGAKPGEGGQLPGTKVNKLIANLRYSMPGITLISPPPHHDIYSIEDLAQLIFDLKQINPSALVSVKLVSEPGVGTIAVGVAKAYADLITISGNDGGTGASPISSIRHAGSPWELGLAETHQALQFSGLRHLVRVQADGGLKTGLDVIKAAILGAESFGFGTAPMIAMGCKYLRICHLNNCATGVATQKDFLIDRHFVGTKERVMNYFNFVAEDVRKILAELGVKELKDIIGKTEYLKDISNNFTEFKSINLEKILFSYQAKNVPNFCMVDKNKPWDTAKLSKKIYKEFASSIKEDSDNTIELEITNTDRSVGANISGLIAGLYGEDGKKSTHQINLTGCAGQSLGVWNAHGLNIKLLGKANDFVGKGMNGGKITIAPCLSKQEELISPLLIGNTALYGATGGELFVAGKVGERFGVRNSGATAVIEGAGDHCCEYMTGGNVTILGAVGYNFAAGMTGGFAYVLDMEREFFDRCNRELVNLERVVGEEMQGHREYLRGQIKKHVKETNSPLGKHILDEFDRYEPYFWLVSPAALKVKDLLKATTANAA